jgi:hypothetical protein
LGADAGAVRLAACAVGVADIPGEGGAGLVAEGTPRAASACACPSSGEGGITDGGRFTCAGCAVGSKVAIGTQGAHASAGCLPTDVARASTSGTGTMAVAGSDASTGHWTKVLAVLRGEVSRVASAGASGA